MTRSLQRQDLLIIGLHVGMLGIGVVALVLGYEYWWLILIVGYALVGPATLILAEGYEGKRGKRRKRRGKRA
ncbi:hypothetical protein [Haloarchaeobius sp. DFWS5]|uniref:hypothetical protein n=1 Tax=Haloarchaeobius sp. DFWS5 TaxID=3446114 RepID=UPI003EC12855